MSSSIVAEFQNLIPDLLDVGKIILTLITASTIGIFLFVLNRAIKRRALSKKLPGKPVPFIDVFGNLNDFPLTERSRNGFSFNVLIVQVLQGFAQLFRHQKLFCLWISFFPFIIITKAEAVEALISGTKIMEKNWSYKFLHPWLGTGLLTSHGSKWKSRRKLLTPSFHFEILKDFLPTFNEESQILVKRLGQEIKKEFINIVPLVTLCSLDIICETTLGVSIGAQKNSKSEYVQAVTRTADIIMDRAIKRAQWPDFLYSLTRNGKDLKHYIKHLHNFTKSVIQEKKAKLFSEDYLDISKRKRKALMDVLLEQHIQMKNLSEEDIREEVDTFAFEGHDTTSMGINWALYLIGLYKDVQDKIHEELDTIFGDDVERAVTTDDIKDMKYLDCVLKESQRLYPSVPFIARQATEDFHICEHFIPKEASCMVMIYQLHRDEKVFPNPEKFDPDRFLPENSVNRHPYAYIPFSAGPRNCIGQRFAVMEEKVVISTVLRNYIIESLDQRDVVLPASELILKPAIPLRIKFRFKHCNKI